jgi:hypothetical protein
MKFSLELAGDTEKHSLEYSSDTFSGSFIIKVDEREVKSEKRLFMRSFNEQHSIEVGEHERLNVTIESKRNTLLREKTCVYVNGRLVKLYES